MSRSETYNTTKNILIKIFDIFINDCASKAVLIIDIYKKSYELNPIF